MKKIALLFVALLGFAVSSFAMRETVTDTEKISYVISEFYPNLAQYYEEGLVQVASLTEETLADGETEYNVRYRFIKSYYKEDEIEGLLKEKYPNEYILYRGKLIKDVCAFKYVDKETGNVETFLGYNWAIPTHRRRPGRPFFRF